jgi:hypothetical protein
MHTLPYEYMYANSTLMSTSKGRGTDRYWDSRSHHWHWRLVVDVNVAYHLTHNAEKSQNKSKKGASTGIWTLVGSVSPDRPTIGLRAQSHIKTVLGMVFVGLLSNHTGRSSLWPNRRYEILNPILGTTAIQASVASPLAATSPCAVLRKSPPFW